MITFNAMEKVRWGIVGPGKIAKQFANDLLLSEDAEIAAVASRSEERSMQFASEYNIPHVFTSYETLFTSNTVDVVYIATPHVFHKNVTLQALENNLAVLCEKPLGVNTKQVLEMTQLAKSKQVFLMEALWSRFNPTIKAVKERIDQGALGTVAYVNADFAFYALDRPKDSRLLNLALAGGTLLDIGIYPVFLAYLFLGMPNEIKAASNFNSEGTEIQTSMIFEYPQAQAILNSSFRNTSRMSAELSGPKGTITLNPRFHESDGYTIDTNEVSESIKLPPTGRGYFHEIEEVHQCLRRGALESELWSHQDSINLSTLLDKIRLQTGVHFPFES